jgi:spore coat polysaccharide biosynthesis protein SpsF
VSARTGVFVQIRLGSTRLPAKALAEIEGLPVARHVMRALALVPAAAHALLTDEASAAALAPEAEAEGWELFVGPAEDVLRRYALAARRFAVDRVVRATGDAPLVSPRLTREILDLHARERWRLSHFLHCPLGTGVEVIETAALLEADAKAVEARDREHITQYLYRNLAASLVGEPTCPPDCLLSGVYVTVDTPQDLEKVRGVFAALYDGRPIETDRLVRWLRENNR